MDFDSKRVIIKARVTDIDGEPQRRSNTLGEAFCKQVLGREFHAQPQPTGYDHVHIPGEFDSAEPKERWFVFDLNVTGELSKEDVAQIPHQVYLASRRGNTWEFIQRGSWVQKAKKGALRLTWGGKEEQKFVARMRNQMIVESTE
ncbi:hypothetical protein MPDQ_005267 [Monascus purpureus]|uniref:Uncharacterized protein n=1 Tax=Monascus purpureus TaxID=5098 RepID=A0A507QKT5_MONPU|nr:hypothetical protein MPDQ_005267 [Monascus purpureus]